MDLYRLVTAATASLAAVVSLSAGSGPAEPQLLGRDGLLPCNITLVVDQVGAPAEFLDATREVAQELSTITGVHAHVTSTPVSPAPGTAQVTMSWQPHPRVAAEYSDAFAVALLPVTPGTRTQAEVRFTPRARSLQPNGITNLIRHELGHVFGLPHSSARVSTMSENIRTLNILTARGEDPWTWDVRQRLTQMYSSECTSSA